MLNNIAWSCYKGEVPKVVDPDVRREAVVEAVFRVVHRYGLAQASLSNVANEAGLAIGSVRHYFASHAELMLFAMQAMSDRVGERLLRHAAVALGPDPGDPRALIQAMLGELLPLNEEQHREAVVWLEFVTAARTDPQLQPHARRVYDGTRTVVARVLTRTREAGRLRDGLDIAVETERLCALIDGLTVSAALQPDRLDASTMGRVLSGHLDSLTTW